MTCHWVPLGFLAYLAFGFWLLAFGVDGVGFSGLFLDYEVFISHLTTRQQMGTEKLEALSGFGFVDFVLLFFFFFLFSFFFFLFFFLGKGLG